MRRVPGKEAVTPFISWPSILVFSHVFLPVTIPSNVVSSSDQRHKGTKVQRHKERIMD
jgi:hypothetical protein